eukprot:gb/GEZN01007849.1/.p1 GENE.gb/GEZN01007849.1/~~gb/GEZN01007849.1/.p1  ORF type:complete len:445 (-),score=48.91 gb/GEZN01007849.1/:101-1435(-)
MLDEGIGMKYRDQVRLRNAALLVVGAILLVTSTYQYTSGKACTCTPPASSQVLMAARGDAGQTAPAPNGQKHIHSWLTLQGYFASTGPASKILIVSAYDGSKYITMGNLASDTKSKYAELWGYHYSIDNDVLQRKANNFNAKSAGRIDVYRKHMDKGYDWIVWTDGDVLVTNPRFRLEDVIQRYAPEGSDKHMIMARDWGGGQAQTGVMFLKCSKEGREFLDEWEHQIELDKIHDDLLAIKTMESKRIQPYYGWMGWTKDMWELQSYPHLELREHYNAKGGSEHSSSHAIWMHGDFMVHVVNCLRQSYKIDVASCDGIAAWYWNYFFEQVREIEDGDENWRDLTANLKKAEPVTIIRADYGTDDTNTEVTADLQKLVDDYWKRRDASARWATHMKLPQNFNDLFGDPVPGKTKRLRVVYRVGKTGKERSVESEEYGEAAHIIFD